MRPRGPRGRCACSIPSRFWDRFPGFVALLLAVAASTARCDVTTPWNVSQHVADTSSLCAFSEFHAWRDKSEQDCATAKGRVDMSLSLDFGRSWFLVQAASGHHSTTIDLTRYLNEAGESQDNSTSWVSAMRQVHAAFDGEAGTFAHFGDSITDSRAFWSGLPYARKNAPPDMQSAFELVQGYMKKECWDQKGAKFGNQGGQTIRWARRNIDRWLKDLDPEVALIMFGTNDLHSLGIAEYTQKTREVVKKCLDNGTVVILSTIPPRHSHIEKSAQFAEAVRKIAEEFHVPLIDYHREILQRRPNDWDGASDRFSAYSGYDVPTLIARDGVHPSNPKRYRNDYSEEGLRHNGFALRNYLVLTTYADVIRRVLVQDSDE